MFDFNEFEYLDKRNDLDEPKALEEGPYPARVTGIEDDGNFIVMYFEICTGDFAGREVSAETDNDLSPDSEAGGWIENILRRSLDGQTNLGDLVGEVCEIEVRTQFGRFYVSNVRRASCPNPELEEVKIQIEVDKGLRDPELFKRQLEGMRRVRREAEEILSQYQ